jgi:SAM-dependent methyltransferase
MSTTAAIDTLVCPWCHAALLTKGPEITCSGCGRSFAFRGDVPVLLAPDAQFEPGAFGRLGHLALARPRVYDVLQRYGGGVPISRQARDVLADTGGQVVLDVGAGTGMVAEVLPDDANYFWLDNDPLKLKGFLTRRQNPLAVLADATRMPFRDASVDVVTMVEVSHHLPDEALSMFLTEAARVARNRFVLIDGLRTSRLKSRALWAVDLGRFPRNETELTRAVGQHFEIRAVSRFRVNHDHIIYDAVPRDRDRTA